MKFEVIDGVLKAAGTWASSRKGAIRNSIKKWQAIVGYLEQHKDIPQNVHGSTCNLCVMNSIINGDACPVADMTGLYNCEGTPFNLYIDSETRPEALRAARAEVLFLEAIYALEE